MEGVMNNIPLVCTLVGVAGVLFSIILAGIVKGAPAGNEKMQAIAGAIRPDTILISVMHANNEVGTVQPIAEIAARHGTAVKVVEVPPGPPVIAPLVAEVYGATAEQRLATARLVRGVFESTPDIVDVDDTHLDIAPLRQCEQIVEHLVAEVAALADIQG